MKKKNLKNLNLKKETISTLSSKTIIGGDARSMPVYETCVSCPYTSINVDCNWSQHMTGDTPPKLG